ncbi:hypothetical protein SHKM778_78040 [Streptomyces sp. KM77-8]|uniref:DUF397 domain-containing protein n=1 Tax=Streptomyces haneummycinicus TaxID=3074435 RepID=A0AAT9HV99_9ACTN
MSPESFRQLVWRKSSYSGNEGGECVEVAARTAMIHVRDSKDIHQPHLSMRTDSWAAFVAFAAAD